MSSNTKIVVEEKFQSQDKKQRATKFNEIFIKIMKKKELEKVI
ncbi:hypothetical protein [Sporanaerobacter acetigenes]|uniref:Uncharacterized protein n=1 Tax=Sporanaerobacter acetigenes DSM 13106 TaxID=1123281 RepID=A0A1M5U518_9FIRM|nr:hypothetical protein [Sporanaerobacter acetigenes]SHH58064.1 hypothetical protein SAMN02745180_00528 [Sporanaerobacter acetigenes DSM 13106]